MEFVGPSKRVLPGYGIMGFWAVGVMLVAPLAYWLRDWQHLQLASSLFALPLLSFWWSVSSGARTLSCPHSTLQSVNQPVNVSSMPRVQ